MTPPTPIFDFGDHYPGTIEIGHKKLPILVKNLTVDELDAFRQEYSTYVDRRGEAPVDAEGRAEFTRKQLAFFERTVRAFISVEPGLLRYRGEDVTTGEGLLKMFHARPDVLVPLIAEVLLQNTLTEVTRKNSNSPSGSGGGSTPSAQTNGESLTGPKQEPTAASAENSSSVTGEAATDASGAPSSGPASERDRIH